MYRRTNRRRAPGVASFIAIVVSLLFVWSFSARASGAIIYVNTTATGANNGSSWTDAYTSLTDALAAATSGDQVWVAAGMHIPTYRVFPADPRSVTYRIPAGVTVYGGFPASGDPGWLDRNWSAYQTVLSGEVGDPEVVSDNAYTVVTMVSNGAVLDGVGVTGGYADAPSIWYDEGGGIYCDTYVTVTLNHVVIQGNYASGRGAGMMTYGNPTLNDVAFAYNSSAGFGAGLYDAGRATLNDVRFIGNSVPATMHGGGMYIQLRSGAGPTLNRVTFLENTAGEGAGLYARPPDGVSSLLVMRGVSFLSNTAAYTGGFVAYGTVTVDLSNGLFANNTSTAGGGGAMLMLGSGSVTVTNTTFAGNTAATAGGAIDNSGSMLFLRNSILWGNTAGVSNPQITDTYYYNSYVEYSNIQGSGGSGAWALPDVVDSGHNIDADPAFVYAAGLDFHLGSASPSVNTGTNSTVADLVDLDGNARIIASVIDMGPYEYDAPSAPAVTTQPEDLTTPEGALVTLVSSASGYPKPAVQWQKSVDNGFTWTDIWGAREPSHSFPASLAMDGYQFKAIFTNASGSATTNAATLTVSGVLAAPIVTANPTDQAVTVGATATFTAAASGNPTPTVQWEQDIDSTWTPISGATSASFTTPSTTLAMHYTQYRAVFTNSEGTATTLGAFLRVNYAPVITVHPADQTVTAGDTASFAASADARPTAAISWQVSTDSGTTWNTIEGPNGNTYTITTALADNGKQYRAVFTNSVGSTPTNAATLTLHTYAPPTVTTHPQSQMVIAGNPVTFTAAATGWPAPTVQWLRLGKKGWVPITGATSTSYTIAATTLSMNGSQYLARFTNSSGSFDSDAATLTVTSTPVGTANVGITMDASYDTGIITWTITLTNAGPDTAEGLEVVDALVNGTRVESVTVPTGATYKTRGRTVIASVPSLASGATATIVIQARAVRVTGTVSNIATVTTSSYDPALGNNTGENSVVIPAPTLTVR